VVDEGDAVADVPELGALEALEDAFAAAGPEAGPPAAMLDALAEALSVAEPADAAEPDEPRELAAVGAELSEEEECRVNPGGAGGAKDGPSEELDSSACPVLAAMLEAAA
jgi:hypothetical protein